MNNRIMAMLFALVAAMFISIVPVKAEAASTYCGHNGTEIVHVAANPATCDTDGNIEHYKCNVCQKKYSQATGIGYLTDAQVIIPKEHKNLTEIAEIPATHENPGKVGHWYCNDCHRMFTDSTATTQIQAGKEIIPVVQHDLQWTVTKDGHKKACTGCGYVPVAQAAHDYSGVKAVKIDEETHSFTCKVEGCGYDLIGNHNDTNKDCVCDNCNDPLEHNLSDWLKDETGHWKHCSICEQDLEFVAGHNFGKVVSSKDGLKHTRTCKDCGYVAEENCIDNNQDCKCDTCKYAVKHFWTWGRMKDVYEDPTCTETGLMAHRKCEYCGLLLKYQSDEVTTLEAVTSDALGHDYQKAISCDEEYHYYRCTRTGCTEQNQKAKHELVYTSNHNGTHSGECKVCHRKPAAAQNVAHIDANKDCVCDDCKVNLNHKLVDVAAVEPACEKVGNFAHKKCETCGKLFSIVDGRELKAEEVVRPALVHTANTKWEKDEKGFHYQWCANNCGTKMLQEEHKPGDWKEYPSDKTKHFKQCTVCYRSVEIEAHDFAYNKINETYHEPVCKTCDHKESWVKHADADKDCLCDDCGTLMVHVRDDLDYTARHNPTCTEDGNVAYFTCKSCNRNFEKVNGAFVVYEKDVVLKALDHDWEEGTEIDSATGKHIESCEREGCKAVRALAHDDKDGDCKCDINNCGRLIHSHKLVFNNPVAATCKTDGSEAYYTYLECDKAMFAAVKSGNGYVAGAEISAVPVIKALTCEADDEWVPAENGNHVKCCVRCGEVMETKAHNFKQGPVCPDCGLDETLKHREAKAATCTEQGNVEYWYSDISGKVFLDEFGRNEVAREDVVIAALKHLPTGWIDNGSNHKQTCQRTGCNWSEEAAHSVGNGCKCSVCGGEVAGHKQTLVKMKSADCENAGHQAYYKCSCGKLYNMGYEEIEAPVVIKQEKHVMSTEVKKDVKEGKHYVQCTNCDYRVYENHGMQLSDPRKGNYHQWLCECGELEIETHYDKNGDNKCDVCDHIMNSSTETTTVEQHDSQTVYTGQSGSVNPTRDWWWNWQEWFTPSNSGGTTSTTEKVAENEPVVENKPSAESKPTTENKPAVENKPATESKPVTTPSTPTVEQTSVIAQFITWFLGLFGF